MKNYSYAGRRPIEIVDRQLRAQFGADIIGVSLTGTETIVHTTLTKDVIDTAINAIGSLTVTTDKDSILATGVDTAVITASIPDAECYFIAYLNGDIYDQGTAPVTGGVVTLELDTELAGVYTVHVIRNAGSYATGSVVVTAT